MMAVPSGKEMADSLSRGIYKLYNNGNGILQHESLSVIDNVCRKLKSFRGEKVWSYSVGHGEPLRFKKTTDKNGDDIIPSISAECISVNENHIPFPYVKWNIALEIRFQKNNRLCARWHFDVANKEQFAPVTHLQYGGKSPEAQKLGLNLDVPRWHTPPMDLILLSEIVAANFFPERWESFRDDLGWCKSINMSQKLCFGPYLDRVLSTLDISSKTILNQVWNDRWK